MNVKREDTPSMVSRRNYEERNKDKRKEASGNFQTMLPRAEFDEINEFLKKHNISKVCFLREGFRLIKEKYEEGRD